VVGCSLELEAQREKREREVWEREMREMEFMEKMKQEMELKLPGEYQALLVELSIHSENLLTCILYIFIHAEPTAVVGGVFYRRLSVCLFFHTVSQKPIQLGSPNLT